MPMVRPDQAGATPPRAESVEDLFEALESPLLRYALRLLPEADTAEDVVQEAFMRLHTHFAEVREPRSWLYRTVHNLALNHQRKASKIVPLDAGGNREGDVADPANDPPDPQPLPDEQIARREGIGLVRLGLQSLDARARQLVELKFQEDLSYKEISARTGLSVGNVGYILHHALKSLAAELAKAGLVP
jgi:RNA polymerase sigma factor (sigma-70 family)